MAEHDVDTGRGRKPTDPEDARALQDVAKEAETYSEPSGTPAEARKGSDIPEGESQLDEVAERQQRLEEARAKMWETDQETGGVPGAGAQEEETARIADHVVFPGTGSRDLREAAKEGRAEGFKEVLEDKGRPSPTDNPDRFPPSEWPPKDKS